MAHEIHDGIDHVVIVTNSPLTGIGNWHRKGIAYDDSIPMWVAAEALGAETFTIEGLPLHLEDGTLVEGFKAIVPSVDHDTVFDCVTTSYEVIQNEVLLDLAETFIEAAQAERQIDIPLLSAGTLRARRLAFTSLGVPDDDALDGLPARGYALNIGTSHDRTTPLVATLSQSIIVCANTYRANLLGRPAEVTIRHTASAPMRVELARTVLREMIGAATELDGMIYRLLNEELPAAKFGGEALPAVLGERPTEDGRAKTMYDGRRNDIIDEMMSARVPAEYRNTAWGGLQAVQAWEQHSRTQRGGRHRAAVAIEKLVVNRSEDGYPAAHKYMSWCQEQYPQVFGLETTVAA